MSGSVEKGVQGGERPTRIERRSERDLCIFRSFDAPAGLVFEAWTRPALFMRWWAPSSLGMRILSCEMDVRTGGSYRLEFGHASADGTAAFFGTYLDVVPGVRLVWTNDENGGGAVTTVTFEEKDGGTWLVLHEAHPGKEALDQSLEGMESCMPEQFRQLDDLLATLRT